MPATIILRQTHPCYSFEWHDEKSSLFSRNSCKYIHSGKRSKSGYVIGIIVLLLIVLTPVITHALP
jgi:hypothetical protein